MGPTAIHRHSSRCCSVRAAGRCVVLPARDQPRLSPVPHPATVRCRATRRCAEIRTLTGTRHLPPLASANIGKVAKVTAGSHVEAVQARAQPPRVNFALDPAHGIVRLFLVRPRAVTVSGSAVVRSRSIATDTSAGSTSRTRLQLPQAGIRTRRVRARKAAAKCAIGEIRMVTEAAHPSIMSAPRI